MDPRDAELLEKLLPTFRLEAEEHFQRLDALLTALERSPLPETLEEAFREVHSLKGAARSVGSMELESLCQNLEEVFARLKGKELRLERSLLDLLLRAVDLASDLARHAGAPLPEEIAALAAQTGARLARAAVGEPAEPAEPQPSPPTAPSPPPPPPPEPLARSPEPEVLRIGAERLGRVFVQAEELLIDQLTAARQAEALEELAEGLTQLRRDLDLALGESRAVQRSKDGGGETSRRRGDRRMIRLIGLLTGGEENLRSLEDKASRLRRDAEEHQRSLSAKTGELLDHLRETLMLPVASLLEQLPRLVRELTRDTGKEAVLETSGGDILIDRRILEELRSPLQHLLRNTVDHALETPEERRRRGKPERAAIRLKIGSPSPRRVLFTLDDDGRGMDLNRLRKAAVEQGLLSAEDAAALDDRETAALGFASGLSTSSRVTPLSGRGLGLSIVREKVERLGGSVEVLTRPGEGTTFTIEIPAALAAFRGVLVRLGPSRFIFPAAEVERVLRLPPERIEIAENRDVVEIDGEILPVVRLEEPLELPLSMPGGERILPVVIVSSRRGRVAFVIDEILAEQEFLVKGLGRQLQKVPNISGSAILGDGSIALVLASEELVSSTARAAPARPAADAAEAAPRRRRVLVAEDSITARTLLRHILEGAGYAVATAVDGLDALQQLASAAFDVVVSDVEMPRMDGFDLTRRIREQYGRLPVVLVTGLASAADREKGLDVGADAYIVKSRFDQSNLLDVLARLT